MNDMSASVLGLGRTPDWPLNTGGLNPQAVVHEAATLLEAVCVQLGEAADRAILLDGLRHCLSTSGATPSYLSAFRDRGRRELGLQAERISVQILDWATEASEFAERGGASDAPDLRSLRFESLCSGHRWPQAVIELLAGPQGGRIVMQLYNEWIHQLIILRDILLPVEEWREVVLPFAVAGRQRGLRAFDALRLRFITEIASSRPPERTLENFRTGVAQLIESAAPLRAPAASNGILSASSNPLAQGRMLDNELLRVFLTVVQFGSFTSAAQMLNRTQAAVSMQIKRLEEIVQVKLLNREGRVLQLTAEGQALMDYAQRIIELNEEALTLLSSGVATGPVRIATNEFLAAQLLPSICARFRELHPLAWVETRIIALGSAGGRIGATEDDLILDIMPAGYARATPLRPVFLNWYAAAVRDPSQQTPVPVAILGFDSPVATRMLQALEQSGLKWAPQVVSESPGLLESMVREGHAVSAFPDLSQGGQRDRMRRLCADEGFAPLPDLELVVLAPSAATRLAGQKMWDLLHATLKAPDYDPAI